MKKKYNFEYGSYEAGVEFEVDLEIFTEDHANETLSFFIWDYNKEENPIDEVMKKYACESIRIATVEDFNEKGVIDEFMNKEGYCKIDGSSGIKLTSVTAFDFESTFLMMEVEEV